MSKCVIFINTLRKNEIPLERNIASIQHHHRNSYFMCFLFGKILFKKMLGFASPTQFDSIIGWVNYPKISRSHEGHTAYGSSNKKMNRFTINSQGYRSEEVDHDKKHILILGDSVAYGSHVDDHETLPHYLNSYYKNYQVINLGVP